MNVLLNFMRGFTMTPSQRVRNGCEAARNARWRAAAPPLPLLRQLKHGGGVQQTWPIHPFTKGQIHRSHFLTPPPPPHLPLFHTRHAEESAERPHLITIVRPSGQNTLRKVTVLLNRRGVVSFEQLLLDISEALGFPRWHRARVTRLYTTHAQEIKGVCDFFQGEVAFLALGKARPELSCVQEALEELFPENSHYRSAALQAWEKKLRSVPDKAAKADSGYSEGTDSSNTHHSNQEMHKAAKASIKTHSNTHMPTRLHQHMDTQEHQQLKSEAQRCYKKNPCKKPPHLPNHLQRLHLRGGVREHQPSVIGPFKHDKGQREADLTSPKLCENCLASKPEVPEYVNRLSGKVPLPPLLKKQEGSSDAEQEVRKPLSSQLPQPISREEGKRQPRLPDPLQDEDQGIHFRSTCGPPPDSSDVTLEDIERCYDIGRVVGDGNFAVVRECRRRDDGQTLAVKIVERSKLNGREHMMQNELSLLMSLCHPRIVRLFAHHHTRTHSYLVMELVSRGDLFEAISERGKFSEAEAGLMVSDVSEALNYIHSKSIVHRDIKPENLLMEHVTAGVSRLKLGDFGLAMIVTEPVFTICGTPTYVAPEILSETGYGVAVDVWALGVILYILLCGFPPFRSQDRDQEELFQLIKQAQVHFLSPYWDAISEEARGLVRALLQPDPTVRLTAGQALRHPWVKAMARMCRQRALTDKAQRDITDNGAEPDKEQRGAQNNATETIPEETPGHSSSEEELTQKEHCRPSEANAGQHRAEYTPTSNATCTPGSLTGDSSTHTDPPAETETQSQLNAH